MTEPRPLSDPDPRPRPPTRPGARSRLGTAWLRALLVLCLLAGLPEASPAAGGAAGPAPVSAPDGPPTRPFPRIETGQHTARIWRIGVDAQGRWLVSASDDKTARVWDLGSGELLRVLRPPIGEGDEGKLYAAAMAPDGATVAVGGWTKSGSNSGHTIYLFDRESGRLRHRIGALPDVVLHLAFSPDGSRLAVALAAGGVRLYDTHDWTEAGRDTDYGSRSYGLAFDRQGRIAATEYGEGRPGRLHLYDPALRPIGPPVETPGGSRPFGVAFSPDGRRIAVGYDDSTTVGLFSASDLGVLPGPDSSGIDNGDLSKIAWSVDGRTLFAGGRYRNGDESTLVAWPDAGTGRPARHRLSTDTIMDLTALADGRLVFGAADPAWGVWRAPAGRPGESARRPGGPAATAPGPTADRPVGRGPAILDFRRPSQRLRLSADGMVMDLDCKVLDARGAWRTHRLRLDLDRRRLILDPPPTDSDPGAIQRALVALGRDPGPIDGRMGRRTRQALSAFQTDRGLPVTGEPDPATRRALGLPDLDPPATRVGDLEVTDWWDSTAPKLNGKPLALEPLETAFAADIAPDGSRVLLGTEWRLRAYAPDGSPAWPEPVPVPATVWKVNLSDNGRFAVAALGDGSVRWYDAATGAERLALFVDGAAIAARDDAAARPGARERPDPDWQPPWVLWTPEGFFESGGGGERLVGWHLNQGPDREARFVGAERLGETFRRPDLIARALDPDYPERARTALAGIGDLGRLLAQARPPRLERTGPAPAGPVPAGQDLELAFSLTDQGGGVGRIEYRLDGAVVGRADARGRFGPGLPNRLTETRRFTPPPGRHRYEARVFDAGNQVASEPLFWDIEARGQTGRPGLYGLAVGIGPYRMSDLSLKYGGSDARAVGAALAEGQGGLFERVDVRALVDEQATLAGIRTAFQEQAAKAGPNDVFVLFLAGHGLAIDGRYHFLPWDLEWTNAEALRTGSLDESGLRDLLALVPAQKVVLLLDSCYSGMVLGGVLATDDPSARFAGLARGSGEAMDLRAAIDRLMAQSGRAVLASSAPGQVALEGVEGHGVFTHVLLAGLAGAADAAGNHDQEIGLAELAVYLQAEVPRLSQERFGYRMTPMLDLHGQFFAIGRTHGR